MIKRWSKFICCVRNFFEEHEFLECHTPCVVLSPGTEPSIDFFEVSGVKASSRSSYLRSSPELHLKKILSLGEKKIFEIGPVFRRNERTTCHLPEFRMLEWYRAHAQLDQLKEDVRELFEYLELNLIQENRLSLHFEEHSIPDLFAQIGHPITPQSSISDYKKIAESLGLDIRSMESIDDYFFLIFTQRIEVLFNPQTVTFVKDYPPFQAAYAKLNQQGWGERFEVYWRKLELGNAFFEVTDVLEQRARFESDNQKRKLAGKPEIPLDEEFLRCLENYPESSGIAMGMERLFMAFYQIEDIDQLLFC